MTETVGLADFACSARHADIGARAREQLRIRLLDTLGVSLAAFGQARTADASVQPVFAAETAGGVDAMADRCIALGRRLDFQDVLVSAHGLRHPSDNIGALLAVAGDTDAAGADLMAALAVAYAVEVRLADTDPVHAGTLALRAGVGRLMGLDAGQMLRVLQMTPGPDADAPETAGGSAIRAVRAALALPQSEAPVTVESGDGWSQADLDGVLQTSVRPHAAGVYLQSAIDVALTVSTPPLFRRDAVRAVRIKTFQAACDAIGRDIDPAQRRVDSPAQARQSLAYIVAVALLDRRVGLEQFTPGRVRRSDVQALLHKVRIVPVDAFTARFPDEMRAQIEVGFDDGAWYCTSASSFHGFTLQPMDWQGAVAKFNRLVMPWVGDYQAGVIRRSVEDLDARPASDLLGVLAAAERVMAGHAVTRAA